MHKHQWRALFAQKSYLHKNAIATVDRAHQEIEEELRKICPETEQLNDGTLAQAVQIVNAKITPQKSETIQLMGSFFEY